MKESFIRAIFFSVGKGSCTLLSFPPGRTGGFRRYAVVDCNQSDARIVREYLKKLWFKKEQVDTQNQFFLHFVALTHYHKDHFNGINVLLGGRRFIKESDIPFKTQYFLYPILPPIPVAAKRKYKRESLSYRQLMEINDIMFEPKKMGIENRPLRRHFAFDATYNFLLSSQGDPPVPKLNISCLAPSTYTTDKLTNISLENFEKLDESNIVSGALRIQYGKSVLILGGDVEDDEWKAIRSDYENIPVSRVKELGGGFVLVPHHGGKGNTECF